MFLNKVQLKFQKKKLEKERKGTTEQNKKKFFFLLFTLTNYRKLMTTRTKTKKISFSGGLPKSTMETRNNRMIYIDGAILNKRMVMNVEPLNPGSIVRVRGVEAQIGSRGIFVAKQSIPAYSSAIVLSPAEDDNSLILIASPSSNPGAKVAVMLTKRCFKSKAVVDFSKEILYEIQVMEKGTARYTAQESGTRPKSGDHKIVCFRMR